MRRKSKYGSVRTKQLWFDHWVSFDSKAEARRAGELQLLQKIGAISGLERQVPFSFTFNGKTRTYRADFVYQQDGIHIAEDVKGGQATQTALFKLKWDIVQELYPSFKFMIYEVK